MSKSGTLLGLAYGDVLGCPVETWSATQIQQVYGVYGGVPKAYPLERIPAEQHKRLRPLGLHSDDTQQALALIHLSKSGFALESWKSWLVEGLRSGAFRGYGRNFSGAVQKLRKGGDLRGSGSNSAGMGAAMRVAPLAALHETPEALADEVVASSLMTHGNAVAVFTAAAVALTAFGFLQGMDQVKIIAVLPDWLRATETRWLERPGWSFDHSAGHLVSETLEVALNQPAGDFEDLRSLVTRLARPHLAEGFIRAHPNQGYGLLGGLHGLLMSLRPEDPLDLLNEIVRQGFDTDTVAAIAGGVLGARHGTGWIPVQKLLDLSRLQAYAEMLEGGPVPETFEQYIQIEAGYTRQEKAFAASLRA